jgi:UDP-N-acetylglucosamine 2-epimerase (non-hydrolysing)
VAADAEAPRAPLVVSIVGTRPEAIKMAPVVRALQNRAGLRQELILTGQHRGLESHFDLERDAIRHLDLNLREQTAGEIQEAIREELCGRWLHRRADLVLVQGDTASAAAGALAARDCEIPVGHVEAGLRSGDLQQPWPEEGNRIRIDSVADLLFAPTELAAEHLLREDVRGTVHVTGNTGIDALLSARYACPTLPWHHDRKIVLATCHRRENWPVLAHIASALKRLVRELPVDVFFLLHTNPRLAGEMKELLGSEHHINLLAPRDYQDMVCLMDRSWLILTDSGGLQEEGPALGKPVLVLRNRTERGEAVETDNVELVGTDPDRIVGAVAALFGDPERYRRMSRPSFPFGDGHAAPRIAALVEDFLGNRTPHMALSRHSAQEKDLA